MKSVNDVGMRVNNVVPDETRQWVGRLAAALIIGILAGVIAFLTARAIGSAWWLVNQQALLEATRQALQEGVIGLANTDLRALRMAAEAQQMMIAEVSAWIGLGVGLTAAIGALVRLELRGG